MGPAAGYDAQPERNPRPAAMAADDNALMLFSPATGTELDRLAADIRQLDADARATAKTALELAMETGRKLIEARDWIDRDDAVGNKDKAFGDWRAANFSTPSRTMREYMNLARSFHGKDTGAIPQSVLYQLAAPKNEEIREQVFEELKEREDLSVKEAKEVIAEQRVKAGLDQPRPELTPEEQAQKRLASMVEMFGMDQIRTWLEGMD